MKRLRRQVPALSPIVCALFALCVVPPRAGLVYHEHRGGEREHVHAEREAQGIAASLHEPRHRHHDHDHEHAHRHTPARHGTALSASDASASGHWHEQQRFHRAIVSGAPYLLVSVPIGAALDPARLCAPGAAFVAPHARGPPALALSA